MSSIYQVTKNCTSDAIDILHCGDYSNPTTMVQVFGINAKIVQQKLQRKARKSSQLLTNKALNLEQKQIFKNYIQQLDEQNV